MHILLKEKEIQALREETAEAESAIEATYATRQECIQTVRKQEEELRRVDNQLASRQDQLKQVRQELQERKTADMQNQ